MDWQAIAKKVMEGYDGATSKAFAAKRAARVGSKTPPADPENDEDYPLDNQPKDPSLDEEQDPNEPEPDKDADDGLDEETRKKLMDLLQEE